MPVQSAPSVGTPDAGANALAVPLRGADFANVLGSLMGQAGRQELAAAGLAEVGLKALPLGPQIQVITAAEPLPDAASLVAFARSQGLDESTVTALFGTVGSTALGQPAAGVAGLPVSPVPLTAEATSAEASLLVSTAAVLALGSADLLSADAKDLRAADGQVTALPLATVPGELVSAATLAANLALGQRAGPTWQGTAATSGDDSGLPASADNSQAGLATGQSAVAGQAAVLVPPAWMLGQPAQNVWSGQGSPHAAHTAGMAHSPAAALASTSAPALLEVLNAAPGVSQMAWQVSRTPAALAVDGVAEAAADPQLMQEAARLRLEPHEAVTRRLADLSGTGQTTVWSAVAGSNHPVAPMVRLDLREFGDLLAEPKALPEAVSTDTGSTPLVGGTLTDNRAPVAQTAAAAIPLPGQQAERVAHYEQLAERLGQALAQRLQAQIERGEWKVQMRLDPGQLGHIQLELDMHAGGLDAVFRSDNQVTRELISQSMAKLRDNLAQSGTAVANVWVQSDSGRQSGGNPTPGQNPGSGNSESSSLHNAPVPPVARAKTADGLDLLA